MFHSNCSAVSSNNASFQSALFVSVAHLLLSFGCRRIRAAFPTKSTYLAHRPTVKHREEVGTKRSGRRKNGLKGGDLTTCNLHLSQNFYESAAKRAGYECRQMSGRTGCRTKRKPKYFLTTSSVLNNEGKQRAGPAARVYTLTTMNKTRADSFSWVVQMKRRFKTQV